MAAAAGVSAKGPKATTATTSAAKAAKAKAAKAKTAKAKAAAAAPGDDFATPKPKSSKLIDAPATAAVTVKGFPETFPLANLSGIDGKGVHGSAFILDGASLDGLQLGIRRVVDGKKKGFELQLRMTHAEIDALTKAAEAAGGTFIDLSFRSTELGADGIVRFGEASATVAATYSSYNAPPDKAEAGKSAVRLEREGGASFEVAVSNAPPALKGFVRIELRGADSTCTKQLNALVKELKLERLFEPPNAEAKTRFKLMRALWQANHELAKSTSDSDLGAVKPNEVIEKLEAAGYDDDRISKLRWEEVSPGYATVLDPVQAKQMKEHGAAYLYSTVASEEHVLSILQGGQKASSTRYREGLIVNGMSTAADFATGGATGVFTRLVSKQAIEQNGSWTGRRFKILLKPEILERTDFYGWNGDNYGKSWNLTQVNFGTQLADSIAGPTYPGYNELIFRHGNGPQYIAHVVATNEADRTALITYLKDNGYKAPHGKSIEKLVILAPTFPKYPIGGA